MNRPIYVFALHSNSKNNAQRPSWFSKEGCFKNLIATMDSNTKLTVFFDGDPKGHFMEGYAGRFPIVCLEDGKSGAKSLRGLYGYIHSLNVDPEAIVYVVEDDFTHRPGWPTVLREAFSGSMRPSSLVVDYATLYDHLDKYELPMYRDLQSRIGITESVHWRTVPSTVNTVACLAKTFKNDYATLHKWCCVDDIYPYDHNKFLDLGRQGRTLVSCLPAYSTHTQTDVLAPCVPWKDTL
jgi:hypothetical protein